ncbi:hypothetical protein AGMMS49949_08410 [Alphaproteobacteria bacterium]|nr:hypothetical protein AGMMS49949_08410 [Alphaproteobacteria bacterium]
MWNTNGDRFEGKCAQGLPDTGVLIGSEGDVYRGKWIEGYMEGEFMYWRKKDGTVFRQNYHAGEKIKENYTGTSPNPPAE